MISRMQTFLSEKEFETLKAIVRTFAHPGMAGQIAESVARTIAEVARPAEQADFRQALSVFDNSIANLVLAG